ncbi:MAG: hypothetical protein COA79_17410 [Planctomycetota bacterium]|nr:MAG: hypothetical protein COA79_17410 [Planctomycetota bacterium]
MLITYVKAQSIDKEFIKKIKFDGLRPYVTELWGWDEQYQENNFNKNFNPENMDLIVYQNQKIGMIRTELQDDCLYLAEIFIDKLYRNKGIGTKIIKDLINSNKPKPIKLQFLKPNPVQSLYEKLGFRIIDETNSHYKMQI